MRAQQYAANKSISATARAHAAELICYRFKELDVWRHARSILLFAPLPDEPDIWPLVAGALAAGKTVTLQTLAEQFSRIGVPVFMADIKGDLTGVSQPGKIGEKLTKVLAERGMAQPVPQAFPTTLWDVFGEQGHPVRATVSVAAMP